VSPDGDEEVHRDQHQLPEEVEQEQIAGEEHAGDAREDREKHAIEGPDAALHLPPGADDGDHPQQPGEGNEQQAQPVHGEVIAHAQGRYPGRLLLDRAAV
jgi:hypothetical protein